MRRLLQRWFWDCYDYLGRLLLLNLVALGLSIPIVTIPGVIAGLINFMHVISSEREPTFQDFYVAFRGFYTRALILSLIYLGAIIVITVNIWFYISSGVLPASLRIPAALLAGIFFWLLVIVLGSGFYTFSALVKKELPVIKALKQGFIFIMVSPSVTVSSIILSIIIIAVAVVSVIGVFIFLFVFLAGVANAAFDTVEERIESMIEDKREHEKTAEDKPTSWHQIKSIEKKVEEKKIRKDRYTRGLRDILRPWDSH